MHVRNGDLQETERMPDNEPVSDRASRGIGGTPDMIASLLGNSRRLIVFAVVGLFLSSFAILIYGVLLALDIIWKEIKHHTLSSYGLEHLMVEFIVVTDAMLLGSVLIIVALGLFQLFIDSDLPLPAWLRVSTLDELKAKLLGVVAVLISVSFVGYIVEYEGQADVLEFGLAIAAVIVAVAIFLALTGHGGSKHE